jgi:outer membrane protein assembly factor BamB
VSLIAALDLTDGHLLWERDLDAGLTDVSAPLTVGESVVVATQDGSTLELLWTNASDGTAGPTVTVGPSQVGLPHLAGDGARVYLSNTITGGPVAVRAFSNAGDPVWTATWPDDKVPTGPYYNTPIVAGGRVYLGNVLQFVDAFDAATGAFQWRWSGAAASINNDMVYADGALFVNDSTTLYAVDAATGSQQWIYALNASFLQTISFAAGGAVHVLGTRDDGTGRLQAIDRTTGFGLWAADLPLIAGAPAVSGGRMFLTLVVASPLQVTFSAVGNVVTGPTGPTDPLLVCQSDLATSQATATACAANLTSCEAAGTACDQNLASCEGQASACQTSLTAAQAQATSCSGDLATCTGNLGTCKAGAQSCADDFAACTSQLGTCSGKLTTCTGDLSSCAAGEAQCESDLAAAAGQAATCATTLAANQASLSAAQTALATCQASNGALQGQVSSLTAQKAALAAALTTCQAGGGTSSARVAADLNAVRDYLRRVTGDAGFEIPGATLEDKLDALTRAVDALPPGQAQQLYRTMRGLK